MMRLLNILKKVQNLQYMSYFVDGSNFQEYKLMVNLLTVDQIV